MLAELIVLELTHLSHMHWLKGVPPIFLVFPVFLYCRIGYNVLTTKIAFLFIIHFLMYVF